MNPHPLYVIRRPISGGLPLAMYMDKSNISLGGHGGSWNGWVGDTRQPIGIQEFNEPPNGWKLRCEIRRCTPIGRKEEI